MDWLEEGGRSVKRGRDLGTAALIHQRGTHAVKLDAQVPERGQAGATVSKHTWSKDAGERQKG